MAARKLPDVAILAHHVHYGLRLVDIARLYGVTSDAVRQAMIRAGVTPPPTHPSRRRTAATYRD